MSTSDAKREPPFDPGRVVAERFEILAVMGQGSTGTVYRARDLDVDAEQEIVALKTIHAHLHGDRQIFGRFRREAKILKKLEGPHLCKLLDTIENDGQLMIALEHVRGPSLEQYLAKRGILPLAEVKVIMGQVCSALETAHANGVIHRDLKPANVLIVGLEEALGQRDDPPPSFLRELSVRVVDFGLAKLIRGDTTGTVLTEQDMIFGTPDYMAPEQVNGEELDARCDVYAAGVMLYEMVVGKLPFDTPGALTTMAAHLNQPVPIPSSTAPERDIPPSLERLLLKALSKNPADRHASAKELAEALRHVGESEDPGDAAGASSDADAPVGDTRLEAAETAISSTLASSKDAAIEAVRQKRPAVRVIVREAASSSAPAPPRPTDFVPLPTTGGAVERRLWAWLAVVAAVAAVLVGVWLGAR